MSTDPAQAAPAPRAAGGTGAPAVPAAGAALAPTAAAAPSFGIAVDESALPFTEMRDAADPGNLEGWGGPVGGYPNRIPPWTPAEFEAHAAGGVMRISVRPEAHWALSCREIDVERFAAMPWNVPAFVLTREALGHDDAGVYFSLSRWPAIRAQLESHRIGPARVRLRVAAWGRPPQQFDLGGGYTAWAHQFASLAGYDRNAVFGPATWSHR